MTRPAGWDVDRARQLYDQDLPHDEIARRCHISKSALSGYASRHWPKRECDAERQKQFHRPKRDPAPKRVPRGVSTLPALGSLE